jgi:hypothetical protein
MTLTPAYGRDYKSQKAALEAFNAGQDFIIKDVFSPYDGKPVNKPQLVAAGTTRVCIRYGQLRKQFYVQVKP